MSVNASKAWQHQCEKHKVFLSSLNWCCSKCNRERGWLGTSAITFFAWFNQIFNLGSNQSWFFQKISFFDNEPLVGKSAWSDFSLSYFKPKSFSNISALVTKERGDDMITDQNCLLLYFQPKSFSDISLTIERGDDWQERNQIVLLLHFSLCTAEVFPSSQK